MPLGHPIPTLAWELPGPLSRLSPGRPVLCTQNLRYFLLPCFHREPAWLILALCPGKARPREQRKASSASHCHPHPPTPGQRGPRPVSQGVLMGEFQGAVTIGCRPISSPGIASLGSAPLGGSQREGASERGKDRGGGGTSGPPRPPLEAQGHPATLTKTLMVLGDL